MNGPNLSEDSTPTSRVYAYTLIPAHTGTLRIPAIAYAYFDPNRATYATTETLPIPLSVRPNPNAIADIETEDGSWRFWVALLLAILVVGGLIAGFFWYRAKFTKASVDIPARTDIPDDSGSEARTIRTELAALVDIDTANEATSFANTLANTLYQYLEDVFVLPQRNVEAVREACSQLDTAESVQTELIDILTKCDYHRFAPVPLSADERNALVARAKAIINHIENLQNA